MKFSLIFSLAAPDFFDTDANSLKNKVQQSNCLWVISALFGRIKLGKNRPYEFKSLHLRQNEKPCVLWDARFSACQKTTPQSKNMVYCRKRRG